MTDSNTEAKPKLDLMLRIAAAAANIGDISHCATSDDVVRRETDIDLGVVPLHLQHLGTLLLDAEHGEHHIINALFWASVEPHLNKVDVPLHKKKLLPDWTVVGVPDDGRQSSADDMFGGSMVMVQVAGAPAKHDGGIMDLLFGRGRRTH